jgi:phosphoribosylaminoimidazole-succinocarboxamide synthase
MAAALYESTIKSLPLLGRGKVRDMYAVGDDHLLIVTTDRLSAFDVVLPDPIPDKGRVLNELSNFWFRKLGHIVPNHLDGVAPDTVVKGGEAAQVKGRSVVARKLKPLPIEAVVRGYLIGSGWKDYQKTGAVCGYCPRDSGRPTSCLMIFTPATKAEVSARREHLVRAGRR